MIAYQPEVLICMCTNYVSGANVYVTDIEVLGYISGYSESQLHVLKNSIEAEVKRATEGEDELAASIKVNANNITSKVSKGRNGVLYHAVL